MKIEARVLKQLEFLKSKGGPFTSRHKVDEYLASQEPVKEKATRMKTAPKFFLISKIWNFIEKPTLTKFGKKLNFFRGGPGRRKSKISLLEAPL